MCVAAGVPQPIIGQLNKHVIAAVGSNTYQAVMDKNGMIAATSTVDEITRLMVETADNTGKLIGELGIPQID